jgi:hypothetical protein
MIGQWMTGTAEIVGPMNVDAVWIEITNVAWKEIANVG